MSANLSKVTWGRVLLAGIAAQVVAHVALVVLVFIATDPTFGVPWVVPDASLPQLGTWFVAVLTAPPAFCAAALVARTVAARAAGLHGSLVGLVVAVIGLLTFWPPAPPMLAMLALAVAAGWLGGLAGRRGGGPENTAGEEAA